jgi:hypothetical protein
MVLDGDLSVIQCRLVKLMINVIRNKHETA